MVSQASMGEGVVDMSECRKCWRDSVYRIKAVGGEYEALACGMHVVQLVTEGLNHSVAQQGKRVQVTLAEGK